MESLLHLVPAALAGMVSTARAEPDAAHGKNLDTARCATCGSLEHNGVGPSHKELIGRRAGTAQGYSYSSALKNSDVVWNAASLPKWLIEPEQLIPGQKMFISIPDAQERADIVSWLLPAGRKQQP